MTDNPSTDADPTAAAPAWRGDRRRMLLGAGLGMSLLPWSVQVAAAEAARDGVATRADRTAMPPAAPTARRAGMPNLDDPAQHLRAYVRMRGSDDGRLVAEVTQGLVFALLPGGRPRLLWQSRGFQLSRYRPDADGAWTCHSNYFGTLADAATGTPILEWDNPFTQRRDTLKPTVYGPMDYVLTPGGTLVNPTPAQRAAALAERRVRRWTRIGDLVTILDELGPPDDAAKPPDFDLVSLGARAADLADPSLASVPSQTAFSAVEPWREWMRMEGRPGMLWWHLQSSKVDGLAQVPMELQRAAEAARPGFVERATT